MRNWRESNSTELLPSAGSRRRRGWSDTSARRAERNDGQIEAIADKNQKAAATGRDRGRRGCSCQVRSMGHEQDAGAQQGHPAREGEQ
ncbi:hypothetical protein GW17_00025756 [Ensete ventricosum]|nr:hypothetical protein GW17_00025756 [Ensete ventricosum]RZS13975.1 hypothetical protein BHM03_00045616 [Ensete ventricosum]